MRATTRPGGRPRRPGPTDRIRATGTRRRRYVQRRAPDPGPRALWMFALVALVLGVGFIGVIVFSGDGPRLAAAPTGTPAPTPVITAAPSPTPALAVTGEGPGGEPTDATPAPDRPTPAPLATAGASGDPGSTTARDLSIDFPQEGDVVVSRRINVFGRAGGGARVVRDLLDGSTADTVARPDGLWVMGVDLDPGENELTFRVDGADAPPVVVHVTYEPR